MQEFIIASLGKLDQIMSALSPPQSLSFFSGGEDLLSNVNAGTGLPATVKAREPLPGTTQMTAIRGRQFPVRYLQESLAYLLSVALAYQNLRLSDAEGLFKTHLNARLP